MKGIWKDGRVRFRRDNNVWLRGLYGREAGRGSSAGRFSWAEGLMGRARSAERRLVHKGSRRNVQAEIDSQLSAEEARIIEEDAQFAKDMEDLDMWADFWVQDDQEYFERRAREREEREAEDEFYEAMFSDCPGENDPWAEWDAWGLGEFG